MRTLFFLAFCLTFLALGFCSPDKGMKGLEQTQSNRGSEL